jgi:hypothetical protein
MQDEFVAFYNDHMRDVFQVCPSMHRFVHSVFATSLAL